VLVDAVVNRQELAMAPPVTMDMVKGFSLFMVEAVINGRANEIIELARTNLWRASTICDRL
jgi:pyruvate dehydrogenase (quinone)